jgi:hypothetical protein
LNPETLNGYHFLWRTRDFCPIDTVLRAVFDSFIHLGWGIHGKLGNFYVAGLIKLENNGAYLHTDFAEIALTEFNHRYFHNIYPRRLSLFVDGPADFFAELYTGV